ncbi:hypothetical protein [Streptomyces sp. NPDC014894]|uniref:hypothetical protein n=1 Tax=Streptomyces sp. NPDC014894 TaxID=3364931 RepID=UPI0036FD0E4A
MRAESARDLAGQARGHDAPTRAWARRDEDRQALTRVRHTLRLQRLGGDRLAEADALDAVGRYGARLGGHGRAPAHRGEALAPHRASGFRDGEACAPAGPGFVAGPAGRPTEALGHYRRARALFQELGDISEKANTPERVGEALPRLGRDEGARSSRRRAAVLFRAQHREEKAQRLDAL